MEEKDYREIIRELDRHRGYGVHTGVEEVAGKFKQPYDSVRAIRSQFLQRKSIKNHYRVKDRSRQHLKRWKKGVSIGDLALELDFPPVLLSNFLLQEMRNSKKRTKELLKNPKNVKDARLRKELEEVLSRDELYTPISHNKQAAEGNRREDRLAVWLDAQKLEYFTENDLRQGTVEGKTPDFLLLQPLLWHGDEYHWVESKASFGEDYIHRKNHRGQVSQYVELYGHGMLVYWYGYLTNLQRKNYVIVDRRELGLE